MQFRVGLVAGALVAVACSGSGKAPPPAGSCHSNADCGGNGYVCWSAASAGELTCGVGTGPNCSQDAGACSVDADCAASGPAAICENDACCRVKRCQPGCTTDSSCRAGSVCASHRCVAAPCQSDSDCPTNFVCSGTCARKTCASDSDCPGYCLEGACYDSPGTCTLPPD
jgi:hypothetical protein